MITITGEPKEIAALVVALQERQISGEIKFTPETADGPCFGGKNVETTAFSRDIRTLSSPDTNNCSK